MKRSYLVLGLLILIISCKNNSYKKASIYDSIPDKASIIITVNDTENLKTNINNNDFISSISPSSFYKNLSKKLNYLDYINTENPVVISFLKDNKGSLQFTIATKQIENLFSIDSFSNHKIETLQVANKETKKITFNNVVLYTTYKDSIAIPASSNKLLESLINKRNKFPYLNTLKHSKCRR